MGSCRAVEPKILVGGIERWKLDSRLIMGRRKSYILIVVFFILLYLLSSTVLSAVGTCNYCDPNIWE